MVKKENTMIQPTPAQITAGMARVRKMLDDYSSFDSGMVSDDLLRGVVTQAGVAMLNVPPVAIPPKPAA
jgi:hypothetical protein